MIEERPLYFCGDCNGVFSTTDVDAFIDHHLLEHEALRKKDIVETNYLFWYRISLVQLMLENQKRVARDNARGRKEAA